VWKVPSYWDWEYKTKLQRPNATNTANERERKRKSFRGFIIYRFSIVVLSDCLKPKHLRHFPTNRVYHDETRILNRIILFNRISRGCLLKRYSRVISSIDQN